ncbi:MAG: Nif3-like dinuclear metal center hexameric protein [Clostridia bacterium]|nr:Nif3-like dinuclear metal center hexameric protein [Clostridia bacterium]
MTVRDFYDLINQIAPFDTQMDFDNSGLLVGSASQEVSSVLFALDLTQPVIDEAVSLGAQLIITHHPLMISPIRSLTDDAYEGRLIRRLVKENISHIAAHTNFDQAPGGINDTLAELCGLTEISGEGFLRCGLLPAPLTAAEYARALRNRLHTEVRLMGPPSAEIRKVGLCSGGGSDEWYSALQAGCNAFISGEIKHHHALEMADNGLVGLECGHFSTEAPGMRALASALQNALNTVECKVRIYVSEISAYSFPRQP